jgi:hypothetical protein
MKKKTQHQLMLDKMTEEERAEFRRKDCERKKTKYPYQRWRHLKRRYGITKEDYTNMLIQQNNGCAICGEVDHDKPLHVDHDHNTRKVRGLLCVRCNTMLGKARDNITILNKAINYLVMNGMKGK